MRKTFMIFFGNGIARSMQMWFVTLRSLAIAIFIGRYIASLACDP